MPARPERRPASPPTPHPAGPRPDARPSPQTALAVARADRKSGAQPVTRRRRATHAPEPAALAYAPPSGCEPRLRKREDPVQLSPSTPAALSPPTIRLTSPLPVAVEQRLSAVDRRHDPLFLKDLIAAGKMTPGPSRCTTPRRPPAMPTTNTDAERTSSPSETGTPRPRHRRAAVATCAAPRASLFPRLPLELASGRRALRLSGKPSELERSPLSVEIEHSRRRRRGAGARGSKGPTRRAAGSASDSA
jgi:hypothetical protein